MATSKRQDVNYSQVSGYIPKELALTFKNLFVVKEINISKASEQMIQEWVKKQKASAKQQKAEK